MTVGVFAVLLDSRLRGNDGWEGPLWPFLLPAQIDLSVLGYAIPEIEVDQALIGNSCFLCHFLEVPDNILAKTNCYRLLEL